MQPSVLCIGHRLDSVILEIFSNLRASLLVSSRAVTTGLWSPTPVFMAVSIAKVCFCPSVGKSHSPSLWHSPQDAAPFPFQFLSGNLILLCHPQAATELLENICCLHEEPLIKC